MRPFGLNVAYYKSMDKVKAKEYYDYLDRKYTEWYTHPKQQSKIAAEICSEAMRWDDEIYLFLNDDRAAGLFEPGFFKSDIQKALELLKEIIDEGKVEPVNKMYKIYSMLENYKVDPEDVARKEMRDYLLDKIHNGELAERKISFKNVDDFDYFSKLTSSIGIDADALLEDIVTKTFS